MIDVNPARENLDTVFGTLIYHIDFYQRQYKWSNEPVQRLLDDVFYKFDQEFAKHKDSDIPLERLIDDYAWYYLNTYVTNQVDGKVFIVDGQQRLTTLSLIILKLVRMAEAFDSELGIWLRGKLAGQSGFKSTYRMSHEGQKEVMDHLLKSDEPLDETTYSSVTSQNLIANYRLIGQTLDAKLKDKHRFESFTFYCLRRLVLINLDVKQTDVPMVFELLGQVDKRELDELCLNELWEGHVGAINALKTDEIDSFFTYYLKAKYANTRGEGEKFDKDYHRVMFTPELDKHLHLDHSPKHVKAFLQKEFKYYTSLYKRMYGYYQNEALDYRHVYFNNLTDMNTQFMLVLSSCTVDDSEESEKIATIAREVDRLFCLLQLQRSYNSNGFNRVVYAISSEIREKPANVIRKVFDQHLLELLTEAKGANAQEPLNYGLFKETGIELEKRFKRYFFARIEMFIAENTSQNMRQNIYDLVLNTGSKNGFHVEHILAENDDNRAVFNNDEELFERERNRLGGLLLLKGKDNQSSNNEKYAKKLKTYAGTLYWNETLLENTYVKKKDFKTMMEQFKLSFRHMPTFGPKEVEERHRLLFEMANIIWN
jgi:hypothetical protein